LVQARLLPATALLSAGLGIPAAGHAVVGSRGLASKKKKKKKKDKSGGAAAAAPEPEEAEEDASASGDGEDEAEDFDIGALDGQRDAVFESLQIDFASIRPNRATPGMLDHLEVLAYGDKMPLKHLATCNARDVSTLVVSVFDPQTIQAVEKAILQSPLGLNPSSEGEEILVKIPTPTEESRQEMCKIVRSHSEGRKVQLRKLRQKAMQELKQVDDKDERKTLEKQVDKFFDDAVAKVQDLCTAKERDVMA